MVNTYFRIEVSLSGKKVYRRVPRDLKYIYYALFLMLYGGSMGINHIIFYTFTCEMLHRNSIIILIIIIAAYLALTMAQPLRI